MLRNIDGIFGAFIYLTHTKEHTLSVILRYVEEPRFNFSGFNIKRH